jgi:hypothetical protein
MLIENEVKNWTYRWIVDHKCFTSSIMVQVQDNCYRPLEGDHCFLEDLCPKLCLWPLDKEHLETEHQNPVFITKKDHSS